MSLRRRVMAKMDNSIVIAFPGDMKRGLNTTTSFDNYTITWGGGGSTSVDTYWYHEPTVYTRKSGHPIPVPAGVTEILKIESDKPVEFQVFGGMWNPATSKFTTYRAIVNTGFVSEIRNLDVSRISHFMLCARVDSSRPAFTIENRPNTVTIYFK